MEDKTRLQYEAPVAKTLELDIEGVVCASPTSSGTPGFPSSGFGEEKDW